MTGSQSRGVDDERTRGRLTARAGHLKAELSEVEDWLWLIVLATLTLDVALTYEGLQRGLAEGNPFLGPAMEAAGFAVLGLTKAVVLGFAGFYRELRPELGPVIPLGLAVPWLAAVVVNAVLLLGR